MYNKRREVELPKSDVKITNINPTAELITLLENELARIFGQETRINLGSFEKNYAKAKQLIAKSLTEWGPKSPKKFQSKMIACIAAFGPRTDRVGKVGAQKIVDEAISKVIPLLDLDDTATGDVEKQFIESRLNKYLSEYEFNESSDSSLLRQLISAEYIASRLEYAQRQDWRHPQRYSSALQNIENRMMKLMEKLGVARFQRDDDVMQEKSNIAELAESLDKKKRKLLEEKANILKERKTFNHLREQQGRDNVNPIPQSEYDAMEKKIEDMETIDANDYFDMNDLPIEELDEMIGDSEEYGINQKNEEKSKESQRIIRDN